MTHAISCSIPRLRFRVRFGLVAVLAAFLFPLAARASDHADPIRLDRLEAGITDLFAFPSKDNRELVLILCVRRSLAKAPPYEVLDQFTYKIHIDLHSSISFDNEADRKRYGGTIMHPERLAPDITITYRLKKDTSFEEKKIEGNLLQHPEMIRKWWSGVRDDPFIFPQFFGTNTIAMIVSIPFDCFPPGQTNWLIWGTSERHGVQIDHVGRSQRTQLPRFDLLNTLPPSQHVAALRDARDNPGLIQDLLRTRIAPEFAIRTYDLHPDVMIYTKQFPIRFPNGRQLRDDVAKLTCEQGDCQLFELSFAHPRSSRYEGGRPTANDKEFLEDFPYLAEPWPDPDPPPPPELTARNRMLLAVLFLLAAGFVLFPWFLYFRALRRLNVQHRALALPPQPSRELSPSIPAPGAPNPP